MSNHPLTTCAGNVSPLFFVPLTFLVYDVGKNEDGNINTLNYYFYYVNDTKYYERQLDILYVDFHGKNIGCHPYHLT